MSKTVLQRPQSFLSFYDSAAQVISTHFAVDLELAIFMGSLLFGVDKLSSKSKIIETWINLQALHSFKKMNNGHG